jgi:hypothetical protein
MSKRRDVLLAVKALVTAALPSAEIRGFDREAALEIRPGAGGTAVGFPGEAELEATDLSPLTYHYSHAIPLQLLPPAGAADAGAALDMMLGAIGAAVAGNRTLGGLVDFLEAEAAREGDEAPNFTQGQRFAETAIVAAYSTNDPLN